MESVPSGTVQLGASGGAAIAGGGDVSLRIVPYEVGQAIRYVVIEDETGRLFATATTGGFIGHVLTGGAVWGDGVGFVAGWGLAAYRARRRRR